MTATKEKLHPLAVAIQRGIRNHCGEDFQRLFGKPIESIFGQHGWDVGKFDEAIGCKDGTSTRATLEAMGPEHMEMWNRLVDIEFKLLASL